MGISSIRRRRGGASRCAGVRLLRHIAHALKTRVYQRVRRVMA
jgi:hypothetical protein